MYRLIYIRPIQYSKLFLGCGSKQVGLAPLAKKDDGCCKAKDNLRLLDQQESYLRFSR